MKKFWLRILTPNIVLILLFEDGRKVGFGVWGIILSTWLLLRGGLITGDQWFLCFLICGSILTGGTMFDTWMKSKFGGPSVPAQPPAA